MKIYPEADEKYTFANDEGESLETLVELGDELNSWGVRRALLALSTITSDAAASLQGLTPRFLICMICVICMICMI